MAKCNCSTYHLWAMSIGKFWYLFVLITCIVYLVALWKTRTKYQTLQRYKNKDSERGDAAQINQTTQTKPDKVHVPNCEHYIWSADKEKVCQN